MEKETKVSDYIKQTEAYQFGKKNAIKRVKSNNPLDVGIALRFLLDVYKMSYTEIAQHILDGVGVVSLDCIKEEQVLIILPSSEIIIELDHIKIPNGLRRIRINSLGVYGITIHLMPHQNLTLLALIEDELHHYINKRK